MICITVGSDEPVNTAALVTLLKLGFDLTGIPARVDGPDQNLGNRCEPIPAAPLAQLTAIGANLRVNDQVVLLRSRVVDDVFATAGEELQLVDAMYWYRTLGEPRVGERRPHIVPTSDRAETFIYRMLHSGRDEFDRIISPLATCFGFVKDQNDRPRRALRFKPTDRPLTPILLKVQIAFVEWLEAGSPEPNCLSE